MVVEGRGCALNLSEESARPGVREVIVDLTVPRAETIGVVLRAHGAAALYAGGAAIVRRPFELGDGEAARAVLLPVTAGTLRLVARVGTAKEDDTVEIDAWGDHGEPLHASAPKIGSMASARVLGASPVAAPPPAQTDEALLSAAAALASGAAPDAERTLWDAATSASARPDVSLVYARAVDAARDLSPAVRAERARSAYARVLDKWPSSWEATIAHAVLAGVRRGRDEAGIETLRDLDTLRAKAGAATAPVLDAFDALVSGQARLFDRARSALDRARPFLARTAFFADAEDAATPRVGAERVAAACDLSRPIAHNTLSCFDAIRAAGDHASETHELTRLRALLGAPRRFLSIELREALSAGDETAAKRVYSAMSPAERSLGALALLDGSKNIHAALLDQAPTAQDAPGALAPVLAALGGDDAVGDLDAVAEHLAIEDRAHPILPSSGTAMLAHTERYDVSSNGLVHWVLFDVRRVSGTTDVDENAQAAMPSVWGRGAMHALRRRILKKDGRIIEPDPAPHASQQHADLSQLEQGDAVEAIYEGYSLPSDTGDVGFDTPDLLPERTAVHRASIEIRLPRTLKASLWSHALLGKVAERIEGDTRVLDWQLEDQPARRVEDSVPKMDRNVGVSLSTAEWSGVARALRETLASLDEDDPEIAAWAQGAAGPPGKTPRGVVEAVVAAAGKALREAEPSILSDYGAGIAPVQTQTARTFLTAHDGSRSWLILRSLRQLGIACDAVVAENDPYSADPTFPPHFGRFVHPLVVAHLAPNGHDPAQDVWIDADVEGPPLPAGRVSPELRGRLALREDGTIAPLPALSPEQDERDEVDVRLTLDAQGSARGTFAIVLRGRDAQKLAEDLFHVVGAERQRALRDVVLAWLPWANVDDVHLASSEGSWQVSLRADISVSGYAERAGTKTWLLPGIDPLHFAWPRARVSSLAAAFASRADRENALAVASAVQYHLHRRIELPKGAAISRMPGPVDVATKLLRASRKMSIDGSVLEDDFTLDVATGTINQGGYKAFVDAAHAADDGFLGTTRVDVA
ncbi:MAG: hypothetical protein ACREJ3_14360, partial [Polyangiaceae bacterium]